jgi:hypothetical protein
MRRCWLIVALTLYLALDVANPLMPGALTFGVEDSVEVRQAERLRVHQNILLLPTAAPSERVALIDHQPVVSRAPVPDIPWTSPSRMQRARSSLSAPPSSPEDH